MTGIEEVIGTAIITAIASSEVASTVIIGTVTVAQLTGAVVLTGALIGLEFALRPSLPKPEAQHQNIKQAIPPRVKGCGFARVGGQYMFYEAINGTSYDVFANCQGLISGIRTHFLAEDIVTLGSDGTVAHATEYAHDRRYINVVKIHNNLGLPTETVFALTNAAFPSIWDSTHRGDGICSSELVCPGVKQTKQREVYPLGLPQYSLVVDFPLLWDFRDNSQTYGTSSTYGAYSAWSSVASYTAGQRVVYAIAHASGVYSNVVFIALIDNTNINPLTDTNATWANVGSNPVLQAINYLLTDMGLPPSIVTGNLAALIAQANICDTRIQKADLNYECLYQSNGYYYEENNPEQVLGNIASTCDMWLCEDVNGNIALKVGKYQAPTVFITTKHIFDCNVDFGVDDEQVTNYMEISFSSPAQKYKEVPGQAWLDQADIDYRGIKRANTLSLLWVYSFSQARRLAKRAFTRLNAGLRGTIVTSMYGLAALGERWIGIDYPDYPGMSNIVVEVQRVEPDYSAQRVTIDFLIVDPATIDSWDPATEEGRVPPNPGLGSDNILPVPQNVTVTPQGASATGVIFLVQFDDTGRDDLEYATRYRLVDDGTGNPGPWVTQHTVQATSSGSIVSLPTVVLPANDFIIEVASIGPSGLYSDWSSPVLSSTVSDALLTEAGFAIEVETATIVTSVLHTG